MKNLIKLTRPFNAGTVRVFVVSFPRSGHHALVGFLERVSNFSDDYCEFYNCTKHNGEPIPCHYVGVERNRFSLECGAGNTYLKNHDFELDLPFYEDRKYIVQYRHPFLSIKSWYEMEKAKGADLPEWDTFFAEKLKFWEGFIHKWIINLGDKPNVRLVSYDSLADLNNIIELAKFSGATLKPNAQKFKHNFSPKRHPEKDVSLIHLEEQIMPLLMQAGIAPLFSEQS